MISAVHAATDFKNENRTVKENHQLKNIIVKKPKVIHDYNNAMGGVDVFDQRVASYRVLHKTKKYWKTVLRSNGCGCCKLVSTIQAVGYLPPWCVPWRREVHTT